jgi:hypothetical protein
MKLLKFRIGKYTVLQNYLYSLYYRISQRELKQTEPILNFHVPAEGLELVILLHTQYITLVPHNSLMHHDSQKFFYHNFILFFPICNRKDF